MNTHNQKNIDHVFDAKRSELLSLLDKSDEIVDRLDGSGYFPSETECLRNQIRITRQRCYNGLFSIALIAPFQSGKTTTLNVFSDGREVAPRGLGGGGIKTSACLVKVQNPDQGEAETAKIIWRSHKDLVMRLDEVLGVTACQISNSETSKKLRLAKQQRSQSQTSKERDKYEQEYFSIIDFRTLEGKKLLKEALHEELANYNSTEKKGSKEVQDQIDLLRFVMIVLAYHDNPTLQDLKNQNDFQPEDIQKYLKFPQEFTKRWNKCFDNFQDNLVEEEFSLSEVMYAFIEEVTYIVNSNNLKKAGAQIVDCPGLFASNFDTLTALKAMQDSSAIWYLLTGENELSEAEVEALNIIKNAGQSDKVFFGVNYKRNLETKKSVMSEISEKLKTLGFTASYQTEFLCFNSFLALRAMQGEKLLSHNLDNYSQEQIKLDTKGMLGEDDYYETVEQAWTDSVEIVIGNVMSRQQKTKILPLALTKDKVEIIRLESEWDYVTDKIKKYVFNTKAWSVLVDNGSEPVINTLIKTEGSLQLSEENAKKSLEKAEEEWENARKKLIEFQEISEEIIDYHINDDWGVVLAKSFFKEVYTPSIKDTGTSAAPIIAEEATIVNALKDPFTKVSNAINETFNTVTEGVTKIVNSPVTKMLVKQVSKKVGFDISIDDINLDIDKIPNSETLKERCAAIIRKELDNSIMIRSQGWFSSLKKGGNHDYEHKISRKVVKVHRLLAEKWTNLDLNHNSYLQGLDVNIPEFSGEIKRDLEKYGYKAVDTAIDKPFYDIGIFFASLYFLFFFDLAFPGLGVILFSAAVLIIVIASRFKSRDDYNKDISNKIIEEITKGVNNNHIAIMDGIEEQLKVVPNFYLQSLSDSFERMNFQLEQRISESRNTLEKSQSEKDKIAEIAKTFRQEDIETLRNEIQQFQSSVEEIWGKLP